MLYEAFWICHQEFKSVEKQNFSKRIFLFTDEDRPYGDNEEHIQLAMQRAADLGQLGVDIELFPMPRPTVVVNEDGEEFPESFNIKAFYGGVITVDEDDIDD